MLRHASVKSVSRRGSDPGNSTDARQQQLEVQAQQRPLAVHTYHRLYPEVIDQVLLNKILVEAVMRKATSLA